MTDERQDGVVGAFAEIQRRSLDAAAVLVERLVSTVDGQREQPGDGEPDAAPRGNAVPGVDDLVAGWARLWRESLTSLAGVVDGNGLGPSETGLQVGAPPHPAPLRLVCEGPDSSATVEVWVHNPTQVDHVGLRVHVTPPCAHDGSALASQVVVDPAALDLPARSGRGVELRVTGGGAAPGTYRALVLVEGLPDQWLPLEVQVGGEAP